jgi:hypothetical protein
MEFPMRSLRPAVLAGLLLAPLSTIPAHAQAPASSGGSVPQEMQRERGNPAMPYVPAQNRAAQEADTAGVESVRALLAEARAQLVRRNPGRANEALERAQTRLLTRSVPAAEAGKPQSSGALSQIAMARRLIAQRDLAAGMNAISAAVAALPGTPTGPGAPPPLPPVPEPGPQPGSIPGEAAPPRG